MEAGLALSPALAWAPTFTLSDAKKCKDFGFLRTLPLQAVGWPGLPPGHFFHLPWQHGLVAKDVVAEPGCLDSDPST